MSFNKAKHSLRMSMFNIINIKMKNQIILALFLSFFILSCEKDEMRLMNVTLQLELRRGGTSVMIMILVNFVMHFLM